MAGGGSAPRPISALASTVVRIQNALRIDTALPLSETLAKAEELLQVRFAAAAVLTFPLLAVLLFGRTHVRLKTVAVAPGCEHGAQRGRGRGHPARGACRSGEQNPDGARCPRPPMRRPAVRLAFRRQQSAAGQG